MLYFGMVKYLSFHNSSFALRSFFNVNGKAIHSVTHPLFIYSFICDLGVPPMFLVCSQEVPKTFPMCCSPSSHVLN
jgi:hypothetical protein